MCIYTKHIYSPSMSRSRDSDVPAVGWGKGGEADPHVQTPPTRVAPNRREPRVLLG
jgi:hypothetical protein